MAEENEHKIKGERDSEKIIASRETTWKIISGILFVLLILSIFTNGFGNNFTNKIPATGSENTTLPTIGTLTFSTQAGAQICAENGKPVIELFSTTWCPHCKWIKETFDKVAKEYVASGKIVAHHWEIDAKDDTLTTDLENEIPAGDLAIYQKFNPQGSIPTFVFGCKYYRIGNGYEREGDSGLVKEEAEFKKIIDELIASS